MPKRFTDTEKYKKPFIRGLKGAYKLLWDYLYTTCDNAGIWIVDFEVAQIYLGQDMKVNRQDAIRFFNDGEQRIVEFSDGKKWFIPSFIEFQYTDLSESNPAHKKIIPVLKSLDFIDNSLNLKSPFKAPLQGTKEEEEVVVQLGEGVKEKKGETQKSKTEQAAFELISYLNELNGTRFRYDTKETNKLIGQRISAGYPIQELREIIEYKVAEWKGTPNDKWLQPDTLFAAENCAKYRNQVQAAKDKSLSISQIRARTSNAPKSRAEMEEEFRIAQAKKYAQ